jgi:hypothetical protein
MTATKIYGSYVVLMTFQFPAWDETDGIRIAVYASSKADAVKRARRKADDAGHMGSNNGGRKTFRVIEAPTQKEG